ncbi:hypothetical protein DB30_05989 [Enhygromyxa salina]|uniref:ASCH domain protein n=1 Tax=Enhygromyxa salina TaxID=215803 RepID=A0A0C2DCB1_9BACT|nr:hypothetical protein [Enhygromyxa salina]KIG19085.1 hypothetical protein DB30_05989 [Enhygromyxa salina]
MSRYEQAKAELEVALVGAPKPTKPVQLRLVAEPVRYAAITVMQPYAWLLAHAGEWPEHVPGKTIENRSRRTNYRGPVLIHVSRRWERVELRLEELRRLGLVGGACPEPTLEEMRSQLGLVIAVAELSHCRQIGDRDPHPWGIAGSWGWEVADAALVEPFGLSGNTGLWYAPPNISVRRLAAWLELGGLPAGAGLRVDPATGRVSTRVATLVEAARVVLQSGISSFAHVVELGGERLAAGELLARAAEEHGEVDTAARLRSCASARRVVGAGRAGGVDRGSHEVACGGERG